MSSVAKIIIKDKFTSKLIALKLKDDTTLSRVINILEKRYEHLQGKNLALYFHGEELNPDFTLLQLIEERGYKEEDRIEITEASPKKAAAPRQPEFNFVEMMGQGGKEFDRAIMEILVQGKLLERGVAEATMESAQEQGQTFISALMEKSYFSERDILTTVSRHLEIPSVDVDGVNISPTVLKLIPQDIAEHYCALPVRQEGNILAVAMINPFDSEKLHDLSLITGMAIEPLLCIETSIRKKVKELYKPKKQVPTKEVAPPAAPERKTKATLIVKDGKRIDAENLPLEESEAPTLWADKQEDFPEPIGGDLDQDIEAGAAKPAKQIWDAPTLVASKEEDLPLEVEPATSEDDLPPSLDMNDLFKNEDNALDGLEIKTPNETGDLMDAVPFGEEIPVFGGANPLEISNTELPETQESETAIRPEISEQPEEEYFKDAEPLEPQAPSDLTKEEEDLENAVRNEFLDSKVLDYPLRKKARGSAVERPMEGLEISGEADLANDMMGQFASDSDLGGNLMNQLGMEPEVESSDSLPMESSSDSEVLEPTLNTAAKIFAHSTSVSEDSSEIGVDSGARDEEVPAVDSSKLVEELAKQAEALGGRITQQLSEQKREFEGRVSEEFSTRTQSLEQRILQQLELLSVKIMQMGKDVAAQVSRIDASPQGSRKESTHEATSQLNEKIEQMQSWQHKVTEGMEETKTMLETNFRLLLESKSRKNKRDALARKYLGIRYYKKMKALQPFPISIVCSSKEFTVKDMPVVNKKNRKAAITGDNTTRIVASIPGCILTPSEINLNLKEEETGMQMMVTPLGEGRLQNAQLQVWHDNQLVKEIPLNMKVVGKRATRFALWGGILIPLAGLVFDLFSDQILRNVPPLLQSLLQKAGEASVSVGGPFNAGLMLGALSLFLAMVVSLAGKSREDKPVVSSIEVL